MSDMDEYRIMARLEDLIDDVVNNTVNPRTTEIIQNMIALLQEHIA